MILVFYSADLLTCVLNYSPIQGRGQLSYMEKMLELSLFSYHECNN